MGIAPVLLPVLPAAEKILPGWSEHFRANMRHSDHVILFSDKKHVAPRCGASGKACDDVTGQKNMAEGGAYRPVGGVATLARCDGIALRAAPTRQADLPHQNDSY